MAFNTAPTSAREDAPTNVKFQETGSVTDGHFISTIVMTDDSLSTSMTIGSEKENLANTKGFRIKYDDDGSSLLTVSNFDTVDYFVLIHSDDDKKHHFAKITKLIVEDNGNGTTTADAFEFEPKLGSEIPKGTKFRVITGINDTNNKIVALSVGLKQEASSADLKDNIVCARPLFYFFNDRLDKENELDHNTKYYALGKTGSSTTVSIAQHASDGIAFRTVQDFGKRIIDYSKFSLVVNLTDKLRDLDVSGGGTTTSNEGGTVALDSNVYKDAIINARRSSDNLIATRDTLGPTRYLHYDTSPEKCNLINSIVENETRDSINQGSYSETKIIDNARIMNKKIKTFEAYKVRNLLHRANLDAFVALKATFDSSSSSNSFDIRTEYDLGTVLNVGDELRIQDKIMIVASIGSFSAGSLQNITVRAEKKTEGGFLYASLSFTPTSGDTLHRRAYNPTDGTIITTMDLINRTDNLEIVFNSTNENRLFATVSAVDVNKNMLTISYTGDSYYSNPLEFVSGEYTIYSLKFDGQIEEMNTTKENSQTYLEIKGRDKLNKLLSPIINKDTVFSEDIIYSTNSPTNTVADIKSGNTYSIALGDTTINTGVLFAPSQFDNFPAVGSKLFSSRGYIGEVTATGFHSSVYLQLTITPSLITTFSAPILMAIEKNYMFTKALGSSNIASSSPTSLVGSAGKGLIFTGGHAIDSNGVEISALPNTSSNINEKAIGYEINSPKNIKSDNVFECILKDEIGGGSSITLTGGTTTNGSADITYVSNTDVQVGMFIKGTGIPTNTRVNTVNSATSATLTTTATATGSSLIFLLGSKATFDTVNTLIDFEVVSTSQKDNITQIELAPYIPITLGRAIDFQGINAQRIEQETTLALTITTGFSSGTAILETTNTGAGFSSVKIGEPLYGTNFASSATEEKGFIGYVLDIIKYEQKADHVSAGNPSTNTTTYQILVDRTKTTGENTLDFDVGDEIFISARSRNHINLLNTAHLWGGKIFSIPHHKHTSSGLVPFNAYRSSSVDFTFEYGNPYYKTFNVDSFRIGTEPMIFEDSFASIDFKHAGKYVGRKSPFKLNHTAYKFKPRKTSSLVIEELDQRGSSEQMPYDKRGHTSIYGSNMTSMRRQGRTSSTILSKIDSRVSNDNIGRKHFFESVDDSFPRLFFYITSDLLPYSSLRTDSLFHEDGSNNATKTLSDYNLFLIDNSKKTDDNSNLILKDDNFQKLSFTSSVDITKLKRFGLMRLTECVFDEYFNLINPEKSTEEIYFASPSGLGSVFHRLIDTDESGTTLVIDTINATSIVFTASVSLIAGDEIYIDSEFVGTIDATGSGTTHNTSGNTFTPSMDSTTNRNAKRITDSFQTTISGRRKDDSIFGSTVNTNYHPLKGAIVPKTSNYNYGETAGTAFVDNDSTDFSLLTDSEVILPSVFGGGSNSFLTNSAYVGISTYLTKGRGSSYVLSKLLNTGNDNRNSYGGTIGVILDTYSIESGTDNLKIGDTTDVLGGQGSQRGGLSLDPTGSPAAREIVSITSSNHFKQRLSPTKTSNHNYSSDSDRNSPADGAYLGFKLRLFSSSWSSVETTITSSNGNLYLYNIDVNGDNSNLRGWLDLVDLTGCYLVSEVDSGTQSASTTGTLDLGGRKTDPIYVYSHEAASIDQFTGTATVNIITSSQLTNNRAYRIMQPNANCFFSKHPDEIQLNTLRPEYTKQANSEEMYKVKDNNYFYHEGSEKSNFLVSEGVLSMFVMIDTDNKSTGGNLIVPNANTRTLLPSGNYEMNISDGDKSIKRTIQSITAPESHSLSINNKEKLNGIVSISQTFVVDSLEELKIEPSRACIGSTATIATEAESLINELLEEEGITYDNTTPTYPLFIAPKFTGVSLFSAINYILDRKDLSLIINENSFSSKPKDDSDFRKTILIDDDKIVDYELVDTTFDFYNQVIVYGSSHKADKKNLSSIKKIGKKTLEVVDESLITEQEVDDKARKLLRLHSTFNKKIKTKVIPTGQEQIRAGDIIQFESKQENIQLDNYIVLDITHPINGFVSLELGKYSKKLEDIFAELLLQSQSNSNSLRKLSYNAKSSSLDFLEKIKLKEMSLLIRTRGSTGFSLGFATTLNTNVKTLGFEGEITLTNIVQEDLL